MCPLYTPLPLGKADPKVSVSSGPSSDILNFYHTRYSSDYGSETSTSQKKFLHKGTGYASNIRPVVLYSAKLDKEENPFMAQVNSGMYNTITGVDYIKYGPAGCDKMPGKVIYGNSGYIRDVKSHVPGATEMHKLWHSQPGCKNCVEPHKPLLHRIHSKSSIPQCYGDTEYGTKYIGKQLPSDMTVLNTKDVGCLELTGHVRNKNLEPITYKPSSTYLGPQHNMRNYSMYQSSYQPFTTNSGLEVLPFVDTRAERNTGNTRENMDIHPPFIPVKDQDFHLPHHKKAGDSSESRYIHKKEGEVKEESGAVLNRATHISLDPSLASKSPWQTHYSSVHIDPTAKGKDREGHCRGGVQKQLDDGFTRSTGVGNFKQDVDPASVLRNVHPTVARSMLSENPLHRLPMYQKPEEVSAC